MPSEILPRSFPAIVLLFAARTWTPKLPSLIRFPIIWFPSLVPETVMPVGFLEMTLSDRIFRPELMISMPQSRLEFTWLSLKLF